MLSVNYIIINLTMVTFLSLPTELLAQIVTDWLEWKAVGRLDRAIINRAQRDDWLHLLKQHCTFRSVSVAYFKKPHPKNFKRCILRQIRTFEFNYGNNYEANNNEMIGLSGWLGNTSQYLTTLRVLNNPNLSFIVRPYRYLRTIIIHNCVLSGSFWDLLRHTPTVSELQIQDGSWTNIPNNLSLPNLTKFSVLSMSLREAKVISFMLQHRKLQRL